MSEAPNARRVLERMRQQIRSKVVNLGAFRAGNDFTEALQKTVVTSNTLPEIHPAYAMYVHVQNQMSVMAEQLLELPEMKVFGKLIGEAYDEYMPSWPPMSPISTSYFWCWANCDVTGNAHRETVATVTLRVAAEFGVHPKMLRLMQAFSDSRMGVYRVEGYNDEKVCLQDIATNARCSAICESGYSGAVGELWFTRVLPPGLPQSSDHVVFTSPYVLVSPDTTGWLKYLDRAAAKSPGRARVDTLERHFKWGSSRRYWPEFVFESYVNHHPGAIFLKGLPDVPESRPHSWEYERHVDGY